MTEISRCKFLLLTNIFDFFVVKNFVHFCRVLFIHMRRLTQASILHLALQCLPAMPSTPTPDVPPPLITSTTAPSGISSSGSSNEASRLVASHVGKALGMALILRSIPHVAGKGQCVLPADVYACLVGF